MPLVLIPALIAAAAAAAQGIAGGVQAGQAGEAAKRSSAADRATQMKIAKMQIANQQAQQAKDQHMNAMQTYEATTRAGGDAAMDNAARLSQANGDTMSTIMRAYARKAA